MKYAANDMRATGELVTLLIPPAGSPTTATPLDVVAANIPQHPATATQLPIYAKVTYADAKTEYGEGGRTTLRKATIEAPAENLNDMVKCFAVKLQNGWVLEKKGGRVNESRSLYIIDVEGYVNVQE